MSAVTTVVATVAAAAGAVAAYRFLNGRARALREMIDETRARTSGERGGPVIEYERDPASGVYRPKS